MKKCLCVVMIWAFYALPGAVRAEEENESVDATTTMEEIVVTATKTEEKRKNIPNAVIVKDKPDINESPATGLGELLANELGLDWRTQGNFGGAAQEIQIRGMRGNATQILVNGITINSPSLGLADVGKISLNNIDRVEVVKGSGSLLYGSGAMGGTVYIITKRPERDKIALNLQAGYGSEGTYRVAAEQGMFISEDFGYYLTTALSETDGFRDNGDLDHKDVSLKFVFDKGDALDISLYGDYIDRDFGRPGVKPPRGTQAFFVGSTKVYDKGSASLLDRGGDEDGHLALEVKSKPVSWLDIHFLSDYTNMENYNYLRYVSMDFAGNLNLPGSKTWTTNEVLGFEGDVEIRPFDGTNILLGAEYNDFDWESKGVDLDENGIEDPASKSIAKGDMHTTGLFAEAQYRPCGYFKALVGLRHEDNSEFGTEYIPRYGLIINPFENTALKLNHGKHFNAPTLNDLFWPYEDWGWGMGTEGNPNLEPETGWHTDATVEQSFCDDKLFLTLSYFDWDIDDKITWIPDADFFYRPENLDTYNADGWELGVDVGPYYGLTLGLGYTYMDAEEKLAGGVKRQAIYTPDDYFKADLAYWTNFGFNATATLRYTGDRPARYALPTDTRPEHTLSSYYTLDLKLEQRLYDNWLFSFQCNNLFDEEYDTYVESFMNPSTFASTLAGFPGAGRSVFFNISYEY